jgi:hypothetical protein
VQEDVGWAVVVHAAVDKVDARGVLKTWRTYLAAWEGCEVVEKVVLVTRV